MTRKPAQKTEELSSAGLRQTLCAELWVPGSWGRFQSCVGCSAWGWYMLVLQRNDFKAFPASRREMLSWTGWKRCQVCQWWAQPIGTFPFGGTEHPGCSRCARGALVPLSAGPKAALAAGDSHEQTQDVCGLTETSRACASCQMDGKDGTDGKDGKDGKDARGWSSSSWEGRSHAQLEVCSAAGGTCGRGRAVSSSCIAAQHFSRHVGVPGLLRASPGQHRAGEAAC